MGVLANYFTVFNEADIAEEKRLSTEVKITSKEVIFAPVTGEDLQENGEGTFYKGLEGQEGMD